MIFLCQNVAFGIQERNPTLRPPLLFGQAKKIADAKLAGLTEVRIVSLISDLNSRGVRPTVHGRDLRDFSNSETLIRHIQQYTVLKGREDIRRVLEWKLNIAPSEKFGAKAEPPLGLSKETVGNPLEAASILYDAIFDQNKFLANSAKKPLNIVLFRRERGGQQLTNLLKTLENVNVQVVVSGIDDGESWRDAARVFNATGIPTAGKTLLDLAQDDSVRVFLNSRIDNEEEIPALIMGLKHPGPAVNLRSDNMNAIYQRGQSIVDPIDWKDKERTRLRRLAEYLEKFHNLWKEEGRPFSLENMPLRSMILVGAAYSLSENGKSQWQKAVNEIGMLLNLKEGDQVILPTEERQHLVAVREDGTVHFSEESLTHYKSESPIVGMWLVEADNQEFDIKGFIDELEKRGDIDYGEVSDEDIEILRVTTTMTISKEAIKRSTRKVDKNRISEVAKAISELSSTQGENLIAITKETANAIKNADVIVYSNVSLEKNLAPVLIVPGIREAIEKATAAVKINLGVTRRERTTGGNDILQKLEQIYRYLRNVLGEDKIALDSEVGQYVDYVLDSYLRDEDEEKVFSDFEPVQEQTEGKVSTVAVKAQLDEAEIFSTELREAIIALLGIKKAGFKVVDVEKNKGKLVLLETSTDRQAWAKGQLGLFKEDSIVKDVILRIKENWAEIKSQGGFVFDVDKTILPKGAKSVTNYTRLAYVFMRLLREGVKVAIISGNSKEEQMSRIVEAIKVQMKNDQRALENLTFYVSGGATKIGFNNKGDEDVDSANIREYNLRHAMSKEIIEVAIGKVVEELSSKNFGLEGDALEAFVQEAEGKYKSFDMQTPWKGGANKTLAIEYHAPQDILDFEEESITSSTPKAMVFPWVEKRGEISSADGETKYGSLAIKPVPKLKEFGVDPREALIEVINEHLGDEKGLFNIRVGGSTTIDITSSSAQKNVALEDFVTSISRSLTVDPEENKRNFFYFGDEFYKNGNDDPIKEYLDKGNIFAINDEVRPVTPEAIHIGRSPQATLEFLEEILIKPAEVTERMLNLAEIYRANIDEDIKPPTAGHVEPVADAYTALQAGRHDEAYDLVMEGLLGEDFVVNIETAIGILQTLITHHGSDAKIGKEFSGVLAIVTLYRQATDQTQMKAELRETLKSHSVRFGKVSVAGSISEDYAKYQGKNARKTPDGLDNDEHGVTMVSGLPLSPEIRDAVGRIQDVLQEELEGQGVSFVGYDIGDQGHTHATISSMIRGQYDTVWELRHRNGHIDGDSILDIVEATGAFEMEFRTVTINSKGEVLLLGAATPETEDNLGDFRNGLINQAHFDGRPEDRWTGVHTMIGYVKGFDKLSRIEKQALAQKINDRIADLPNLGTMTAGEVSLVYYLHRSLSKVVNKIPLKFGESHPELRGRVDGLLLKSAPANLSSLKITPVLFFDQDVLANSEGFEQALKQLGNDKGNIPVILLTEETEESARARLQGVDLAGVRFRTLAQLGLQDFGLQEVMSLIDGIDNLRVVPLTDALTDAYEALKKARDQV